MKCGPDGCFNALLRPHQKRVSVVLAQQSLVYCSFMANYSATCVALTRGALQGNGASRSARPSKQI
jgi:hypothetical protein